MSFRIDKPTLLRLKKRLPFRGQRSLVINRLIQLFLDGRVIVTIPERRI